MSPASKTTRELYGGLETSPEIQSPGAVCPGSHEPLYDKQSVLCQCGGDCDENLLILLPLRTGSTSFRWYYGVHA